MFLSTNSRMLLVGICLTVAAPASADVVVTFSEGAPKDRFSVEMTGSCALGAQDVVIDLSGSAAGLVFDVTSAGAGVEVYQPFEVVSGQDLLSAQPVVRDGDQKVILPLSGLPAGRNVAFTIDVDDTLGQRGITVSGSEITGATVRVAGLSAPFGPDAVARLTTEDCLS